MRNYSIDKIARAADAVIPDQPPKHPMHKMLRNNREMLLCGIVSEMSNPRCSLPEIESVIGCPHTSVMVHLKQWSALPWQDRYGWLRLVEGRLINETHTVDAALL